MYASINAVLKHYLVITRDRSHVFHKESLTLISSGLLHLDLALQEKTISIRTEMKKEIISFVIKLQVLQKSVKSLFKGTLMLTLKQWLL